MNYSFFYVAIICYFFALSKSWKWLPDIFGTDNDKLYDLPRINSKIPPSVSRWNFIHEKGKLSIISMVIDHHSDGSWYVPSLHEKYSIGWNRSIERGYLLRPYACNIRFFGLGLESTLKDFVDGGTGYLVIHKADDAVIWHGEELNETQKIHCYYYTNKGYGSNFFDSPKSYGVVISCPITLDMEVGNYADRATMHPGYFCRVLSDSSSEVQLHLRPPDFRDDPNVNPPKYDPANIVSLFNTPPYKSKLMKIKEIGKKDTLLHAVCTVQTFRNPLSGPMLFLFVSYYIRLGWSVIVYDRFGFHKEFLVDILHLDGFYYHPFTVYQLAQPTKYNEEYASKQGFGSKYYYNMEKNWVKGYGGVKADTADQDMDKTKTYDYARLEYFHMESILYLDADEFFFCPQASNNIQEQRDYHSNLMNEFVAQGIEEMRFSRLPYAGLAPPGSNNTAEFRAEVDLTGSTQNCMLKAFIEKSEKELFKCWSSASTYDDFPKSADFGAICPFHYNHWSCDGMRGGGRDWGKRCRCKVAFDMINHLVYKPVLDKCHLLHFNDNKYRFQLIRKHGKRKSKQSDYVFDHDNGNILDYNPIAYLYMNKKDGEDTQKFDSHIFGEKDQSISIVKQVQTLKNLDLDAIHED